jgi:hypothetical protein
MTQQNLTETEKRVFFTQYGDNKMVEFNGTSTQAREYCKRNYGVKYVNTYYTITRELFLPVGYVSIEIV